MTIRGEKHQRKRAAETQTLEFIEEMAMKVEEMLPLAVEQGGVRGWIEYRSNHIVSRLNQEGREKERTNPDNGHRRHGIRISRPSTGRT